jgi:hypothetical protein
MCNFRIVDRRVISGTMSGDTCLLLIKRSEIEPATQSMVIEMTGADLAEMIADWKAGSPPSEAFSTLHEDQIFFITRGYTKQEAARLFP